MEHRKKIGEGMNHTLTSNLQVLAWLIQPLTPLAAPFPATAPQGSATRT